MAANSRVQMLTERLQQALTPVTLTIEDESLQHVGHIGATSGGGHFKINVVSNKFQDKSTIERHKMVYMALGDAMSSVIHAVSISAKTPAEATSK